MGQPVLQEIALDHLSYLWKGATTFLPVRWRCTECVESKHTLQDQ